MKKFIQQSMLLPVILFSIHQTVQAKVWRVNRDLGVVADFRDLSIAVASPLVQDGDTLYIEPNADFYGTVSLRKRVTMIGAGYFLDENPGLQYQVNSSYIASVTLDSLASGSKFLGLKFSQIYASSNVDDITISSCQLSLYTNNAFANSRMANWKINKSILSTISITNVAYIFENLEMRNCIITSSLNMPNQINGLFRNNTSTGGWTVSNSYLSNNIFIGNTTHSFTNCTVKYNLSQGANNIPSGNNNQLGIPVNTLILNTGSSDGKFVLAPGSPAIGAGEPINGVTPDAGAFGTADPYRLSGIPPIPSIYELVVPANVPSSSTTMNVTISTRSNN